MRLEFQVAFLRVSMMEAAQLAAHANTWIPSEPLNQDMDAQLRYLLFMLTSGPALQIIRQQPSGVQAFRDLARRYNPRSQARSLAQLQAHLWLTTGLRHHETDSGKLLSGETVMAAKPFNADGRSANGNQRFVRRQRQERQTRHGQERQGQRKAQG